MKQNGYKNKSTYSEKTIQQKPHYITQNSPPITNLALPLTKRLPSHNQKYPPLFVMSDKGRITKRSSSHHQILSQKHHHHHHLH